MRHAVAGGVEDAIDSEVNRGAPGVGARIALRSSDDPAAQHSGTPELTIKLDVAFEYLPHYQSERADGDIQTGHAERSDVIGDNPSHQITIRNRLAFGGEGIAWIAEGLAEGRGL